MCVCVIGVLRRFQQSFSHITTGAACCMRRDSAWVLSAANTDAPCCTQNVPPSHIILTPGQPDSTNFNTLGLAWLEFEPAAFQLRGKCSHLSTTVTGILISYLE